MPDYHDARARWEQVCAQMGKGSWPGSEADALAEIERCKSIMQEENDDLRKRVADMELEIARADQRYPGDTGSERAMRQEPRVKMEILMQEARRRGLA